ncbi:MAG: hypothetical protein ACFFAU_06330 [Candidatus Hodarchaeota archaeon]
MPTIEENAKKIEMLSRVARLLGDQLREQSKKIELLQEEISSLRKELTQKPELKIPSLSRLEEDTNHITSSTSSQANQEAVQSLEIRQEERKIISKESSEKEELLQALKVIDDL